MDDENRPDRSDEVLDRMRSKDYEAARRAIDERNTEAELSGAAGVELRALRPADPVSTEDWFEVEIESTLWRRDRPQRWAVTCRVPFEPADGTIGRNRWSPIGGGVEIAFECGMSEHYTTLEGTYFDSPFITDATTIAGRPTRRRLYDNRDPRSADQATPAVGEPWIRAMVAHEALPYQAYDSDPHVFLGLTGLLRSAGVVGDDAMRDFLAAAEGVAATVEVEYRPGDPPNRPVEPRSSGLN